MLRLLTKSILGAIDLLKYGLICRIGTGDKVSVWSDSWIPRKSCRKPITPDLYQLGDVAVSSFLRASSQRWDINILNCVL